MNLRVSELPPVVMRNTTGDVVITAVEIMTAAVTIVIGGAAADTISTAVAARGQMSRTGGVAESL